MKIVVLGGGPAGLYFAIQMKKADASHDVTVIERNPLDATFGFGVVFSDATQDNLRSEEHTSELQSQSNLVCRLLLEKKKDKTKRFLGAPPASTPAAMQAGSPTQRLT